MRVLMIVFSQVGKGTYWRAFHLGRALARRGHAVTLMAMSPQSLFRMNERDVNDVHVVETPDLLLGPLRSGWDAWDTLRRIAWLHGRSFDIVHAFESRPVVILPALVAQQSGAKLVMDWCDWFGRGGSVEERPNPIVRAVLRPVETFFEESFRTRAIGTTVINTFLRDRAINLGVRPESILLIRNGTDPNIPLLDCTEARRMVRLPPDVLLLGYVGGIFARDAELMADAFNRVRQELSSVQLLLVGYFNCAIESLLDEPSAIIRTGPVTSAQVYQYLSACDVCWLPLRNSGANRGRWPYKLNDYMTVGRPVVVTAVGDLPDIVTHYQLGLVARDDAREFASQTVGLFKDSRRREVIGQAARRAAEGEFSWERLTQDLAMLYKQVQNPQR